MQLLSGCLANVSSLMRDKTRTPPHLHKYFELTFDIFFQYLEGRQPKGGIVEQVPGFATPFFRDASDVEPFIPLNVFAAKLRKLGYRVRTFRINSNIWMECPREVLQWTPNSMC